MFPAVEPDVIVDVAQVSASFCATQLTIFSQIRFWSQYSANKKSMFGVMNKEGWRRILDNIVRIKLE